MAEHEKHTPGPWRADSSENNAGVEESWGDVMAVGFAVATIWQDTERLDIEASANASLIAAAPDLLAACEMIASFAQSWQPLTPGDIRIVKDAIAKATTHGDQR